VYVPAVAEGPTEIVKTEVAVLSAGGVTDAGLGVAVTPVGAPVAVKLTAELKPLRDVTVIVDVSEPPSAIVNEVGEADIEKSGAAAAVTVRVIVAV
jgi:hypothetical protein